MGVKDVWNGLPPVKFVNHLCEEFSGEFVVMLFSTYFGVKGALYALASRASVIYCLSYLGLSGENTQRLRTFGSTPWALKAAIGALSDSFPIYGFHKIPYMIVSTLLGVVSFIALAVLPLGNEDYREDAETSNTSGLLGGNQTDFLVSATPAPPLDGGEVPFGAYIAGLLLFCVMLQVATVDLLTEGRYAQMMVDKPKTGGSLVTWVWTSYFVGALCVSAYVGPFLDNFHIRVVFITGVPLSLQVLWPLFKGYLKEVPFARFKDKLIAFDREKYEKEKPMYALAAAMCIGAVINATAGLLVENPYLLLTISWLCGAALIGVGYLALPRAIASANCYIFLCQSLYLQITGVLDPWFLSGEECVPDGPHFSSSYYFTTVGIIGCTAALFGTCLFQMVFRHSTFRRAFWMTTVMRALACGFDLIMVSRIHRPHIPDWAVYIFGNAIILEVVTQLDFMPSVVLVSKVCPRGYESMVYAMLGGFQNFGHHVASNTGIVLAKVLGVGAGANSTNCHWDNLSLLILISHGLLPLVTVPLTFVLLPDAKLTDDILTKTGMNELGHGAPPGTSEMLEISSEPSDAGSDQPEVHNHLDVSMVELA
eukprot:TRINITY_DN72906_c0_g1_i1.p1 TRINITY_DN72906_c0_g1~~TRINITY_DN72906_c0_g1_i1.p1  ORF type:complete len:602 (+),score=219.90 TRINITY_DN72906_c0_g1_i1:24-1808(+)